MHLQKAKNYHVEHCHQHSFMKSQDALAIECIRTGRVAGVYLE
jgi:hypothetical protein